MRRANRLTIRHVWYVHDRSPARWGQLSTREREHDEVDGVSDCRAVNSVEARVDSESMELPLTVDLDT